MSRHLGSHCVRVSNNPASAQRPRGATHGAGGSMLSLGGTLNRRTARPVQRA